MILNGRECPFFLGEVRLAEHELRVIAALVPGVSLQKGLIEMLRLIEVAFLVVLVRVSENLVGRIRYLGDPANTSEYDNERNNANAEDLPRTESQISDCVTEHFL